MNAVEIEVSTIDFQVSGSTGWYGPQAQDTSDAAILGGLIMAADLPLLD